MVEKSIAQPVHSRSLVGHSNISVSVKINHRTLTKLYRSFIVSEQPVSAATSSRSLSKDAVSGTVCSLLSTKCMYFCHVCFFQPDQTGVSLTVVLIEQLVCSSNAEVRFKISKHTLWVTVIGVFFKWNQLQHNYIKMIPQFNKSNKKMFFSHSFQQDGVRTALFFLK